MWCCSCVSVDGCACIWPRAPRFTYRHTSAQLLASNRLEYEVKTTQLSAHAWQLTRWGLVNCYLVRESDGFTLIDTGLPKSGEAILDAARHCGPAGGGEINRILLTHAHADHI